MMANKYIQIDREGYLLSDGLRLDDEEFGHQILENLKMQNRTYITEYKGTQAFVEAFDIPLIIQSVEVQGQKLVGLMPYNYRVDIVPSSLSMDAWDRFYARRPSDSCPLLFSRKAQAQLFDVADGFTDESITLFGQEQILPDYFESREEVTQSQFWSERFSDAMAAGEVPPWDLKGHLGALEEILPQLKILKQRIAVMGCGSGHDANYLASLGHIVTAFDFSEEALKNARESYPESQNLKFVQMDLLEPKGQYLNQFDMIFEHTFFCAIDPQKRDRAVQTYRQLLAEDGHLLANFFMITPEGGPPFGATEWEIERRLEKSFRNLFWTRWRKSPESRQNWELIYYGQKL